MKKKIGTFAQFIEEKKKSPYKKATLLKYKRKYEKGEEIPFGIESSLKAQGLIPRADGSYKVSDEYRDTGILRLSPIAKTDAEIEQEKELKAKEKEERAEKRKKRMNEDSNENPIDSAETTYRTTDKEGKEIYVKEIEKPGACYEPYTHAYIFHDGKISSREHLEEIMDKKCYDELCEYLNDISLNNEASAHSYMNLPYSFTSSSPILTNSSVR